MDVMEAIKERRSIRKYKPDPVPEAALQTILEAVRWTPSWANTQCWQVIVIKDPARKGELLKAIPKGNPAFSAVMEAPLVLVLCGKKGVSGYKKGQAATDKGDWLMFDVGLAMQNLCLAAHVLGLGTVIVGLFDHGKVTEILGLSSEVEVVAMTPLGFPANPGSITRRKEISDFVYYDAYPAGNR